MFCYVFLAAVNSALGNSDCLGRYADPSPVQCGQRGFEAFAQFAQQVFFGDFAILKYQFIGCGAPNTHLLFFLPEGKAGGSLFYNKGRNSSAFLAWVCNRADKIDVCIVTVGNENFRAIYQPNIPLSVSCATQKSPKFTREQAKSSAWSFLRLWGLSERVVPLK